MQRFYRRHSVALMTMLLVSLCSACREPAVRTHAFSHSIQNYVIFRTISSILPAGSGSS